MPLKFSLGTASHTCTICTILVIFYCTICVRMYVYSTSYNGGKNYQVQQHDPDASHMYMYSQTWQYHSQPSIKLEGRSQYFFNSNNYCNIHSKHGNFIAL